MLGNQTIIALLIPIVAIVMSLSIPIWVVYWEYRKRKDTFALLHQERMAAIEKGVEPPPLPAGFLNGDAKTASPRRYLLKGLVWTFIGLGIIGALFSQHEQEAAMFGLIPTGIGLAYLIYYFAAGKKEAEALDAAKIAETSRPRTV
jgi:peptidoglycan/LPS O-acetylase OafA/YrhL